MGLTSPRCAVRDHWLEPDRGEAFAELAACAGFEAEFYATDPDILPKLPVSVKVRPLKPRLPFTADRLDGRESSQFTTTTRNSLFSPVCFRAPVSSSGPSAAEMHTRSGWPPSPRRASHKAEIARIRSPAGLLDGAQDRALRRPVNPDADCRGRPRAGDRLLEKRPRFGLIMLAAGLSRRMGGPNKLLQPYRGKPLLAHALRVARGDRVRRSHCRDGTRLRPRPKPWPHLSASGAFSIRASPKASGPPSRPVCVPCSQRPKAPLSPWGDMPEIGPEVYRALAETFTQG